MSISAEQLKARVMERLQATWVEVTDESHLHAGHEGAKSGGRHFRIKVKSPRFTGLATLARHRLVYDAVSDWMNREIHALAIDMAGIDDNTKTIS
ncbi:MAG: BolA family protein [Limnobacter sp.]|uniref:BolA family protein n=1 Tax=Limnobacter sp. TaxID=2003368 RepID=UPI00391CA7EE